MGCEELEPYSFRPKLVEEAREMYCAIVMPFEATDDADRAYRRDHLEAIYRPTVYNAELGEGLH